MLSIDRNLLPPAYATQFAKAQYSAPPLSYPLVVRTFRRVFGKQPPQIFSSFSKTAAHGASIGQVHRASKDGHEYAVKVQYPGVADSLRTDIRGLKPIALERTSVYGACAGGWRGGGVARYVRAACAIRPACA